MTLRQQTSRGLAWMALATALNAALSAGQLFVAARLLDEAVMGAFALFTLVLGAALILFDVGISQAAVYSGADDPRRRSGLLLALLLFGTVGSVLILVGRDLLAAALNAPTLAAVLVLIPLALLLFLPAQLTRSLLEREMAFRKVAQMEAFAVSISMLLSLVLLFAGYGLWALAAGAVFTFVLQAALIAYNARPRLSDMARVEPSFAAVRNALRFGLPHTAQKIFTFVVANVDFILIGAILGAGSLGQYAVAYNVSNFITSRLNPVIARVIFPALRQLSADPPRANRAICLIHDLAATLGGAPLLGLGAIAPVAIPWILGPHWVEAGLLVQILAFVGYTRLIGSISGPSILAFGKPQLGLTWSIFASLLQIAAIFVGVRLGGSMGVALAFAILQVIFLPLSWYMLFRPLSGMPFGQYMASILPGMLTSIAVWLAATAVLHVGAGLDPIATMGLSIGAGVAAFALALLARRDFTSRAVALIRGSPIV